METIIFLANRSLSNPHRVGVQGGPPGAGGAAHRAGRSVRRGPCGTRAQAVLAEASPARDTAPHDGNPGPRDRAAQTGAGGDTCVRSDTGERHYVQDGNR